MSKLFNIKDNMINHDHIVMIVVYNNNIEYVILINDKDIMTTNRLIALDIAKIYGYTKIIDILSK